MSTKLWIVFKFTKGASEFQGVFDSEELAVDACTEGCFCVCPATLNAPIPSETVFWPGCYYPKQS